MVMDHCKKCGVPIQEFLTGRKKIAGEIYCKKCYYKELGNLMEEHPIGIPLSKRIPHDLERQIMEAKVGNKIGGHRVTPLMKKRVNFAINMRKRR